MQHGTLLRLVFHDDLTEIGAYNEYDSSEHWLALTGFQKKFYRKSITDIFALQNRKWIRQKGQKTLYDQYIENGGQESPKLFFKSLYENDI
jgi:hypothetical protein